MQACIVHTRVQACVHSASMLAYLCREQARVRGEHIHTQACVVHTRMQACVHSASTLAYLCHEQGRVRGEPCLQEFLPSLSNTIEHFDMLAETYRGAVRLSLKMCHDQLADYDKLRVQVKPNRSVVAIDSVKAKELRLVPLSPAVQLVRGSAAPPPSGVLFGPVFDHPKTGEPMTAWILPKVSMPKADAAALSGCASREPDTFVIPYWLVRLTPDSAMANLELASHGVQIVMGAVKLHYNVPILTNKTPLEAGDELLLYRAVGVKRPIREVEEADTDAAAKGKAQPKRKGKAKGRGRRA